MPNLTPTIFPLFPPHYHCHQVYRLNLSEGRFLSPLPTHSPAVNACGISPSHGLLACAGEDGVLECFDLRQRNSLGWLDAAGAAGARGQALTALRFDDSGMHLAVGTANGLVALFDLRSQARFSLVAGVVCMLHVGRVSVQLVGNGVDRGLGVR